MLTVFCLFFIYALPKFCFSRRKLGIFLFVLDLYFEPIDFDIALLSLFENLLISFEGKYKMFSKKYLKTKADGLCKKINKTLGLKRAFIVSI